MTAGRAGLTSLGIAGHHSHGGVRGLHQYQTYTGDRDDYTEIACNAG